MAIGTRVYYTRRSHAAKCRGSRKNRSTRVTRKSFEAISRQSRKVLGWCATFHPFEGRLASTKATASPLYRVETMPRGAGEPSFVPPPNIKKARDCRMVTSLERRGWKNHIYASSPCISPARISSIATGRSSIACSLAKKTPYSLSPPGSPASKKEYLKKEDRERKRKLRKLQRGVWGV